MLKYCVQVKGLVGGALGPCSGVAIRNEPELSSLITTSDRNCESRLTPPIGRSKPT